jgi:hypothetical protein
MSVFGDILSKIFRHPKAQAAPAAVPSQAAPAAAPAAAAPAAAATTEAPAVDVAAVLEVMAKDYGQPSNWRESIVDLLKLLSIDSSLANRKALAAELGYTDDTDDSATMNVWLQKAVMRKLAENGGIVPDSLR